MEKTGKNLEKSIFGKFDELDEIAELVRANENEVKKFRKNENTLSEGQELSNNDAFSRNGRRIEFCNLQCWMKTITDGSSMQCTAEKAVNTYIKEVVNGESYIELSSEEKECLEKAVYQEKYDLRDMEE